MLKERRSSKAVHNDFLDYLLKEVDKDNTILSEGIAVDLIFALLFATYETTSASITLLMKFISEKPQVLLELKVYIFLLYMNKYSLDYHTIFFK